MDQGKLRCDTGDREGQVASCCGVDAIRAAETHRVTGEADAVVECLVPRLRCCCCSNVHPLVSGLSLASAPATATVDPVTVHL